MADYVKLPILETAFHPREEERCSAAAIRSFYCNSQAYVLRANRNHFIHKETPESHWLRYKTSYVTAVSSRSRCFSVGIYSGS